MTTAAAQVGHQVAADVAVQHASRILLACQQQDGWWPDQAVAAVTQAAEGLLALEFLGIRTAELTRAATAHLKAAQRADGSWAGGEPGRSADLSASALSYLALRLAGEPPYAYHMAAAAGWIRDAGGVEEAGVTARTWLALFGLADWDSVPVPLPELVCLPGRARPVLPAWAGWSRLAVAALAVIGAVQPVHPLTVALADLQVAASRDVGASPAMRPSPVPLAGARFAARPAALRRLGNWLADWLLCDDAGREQRHGWSLALVALHLLGYQLSHPALAAGLATLESALEQPGDGARGLPPVAQTALAVEALRGAGLPGNHPALVGAGRWLLRQQVQGRKAGHGARAERVPCGWSFCPDGYPRPADTACVLLALGGVELPGLSGWPAIGRAARWLAGTQDRDGSWAGSAALTAYCVRALSSQAGTEALAARAVRRGVVWLLRAQLSQGAWPGSRGSADLLATTATVLALLAAGVLPGKPCVRTAVDWLLGQQSSDGGWKLGDSTGEGTADCDAVATAWALAALLAVGGTEVAGSADSAAAWLVRAQLADGSWPAPVAAPNRPTRGGRRLAAENSPVVGVLLPLAALGRYVSADGAVP